MSSLSEKVNRLANQLAGVKTKLLSIKPSSQVYAAIGEIVIYGCKVTEGDDATDMDVTLEGQASGDSDNLNPDIVDPPVKDFHYPNIASTKDGGFFSEDTTATVEEKPASGSGRYDIAYLFVGPGGAGLGIATGTPGSSVKTDFDDNGLDTDLFPSDNDPSLPVGAMPVARIYVEDDVTGIPDSRIADIRVLGVSASDISQLTDISSEIQTVAGISDDVETVAGISSDVTTVAGIESEVTTVAGVSAEVQTVAGIETEVTGVNAISTEVQGVYSISSDVQTVAGISGNVTTVAGIEVDVTTVAGIESDVTTVAGIEADVTTVAGISSDVETVADNITDIQNAEENADIAIESAGQISSSSTSSVTVGTGSKSFTTDAGLSYVVGAQATVYYRDDIDTFMEGEITAYDEGTGDLTIDVTDTGGSGAFSDWVIVAIVQFRELTIDKINTAQGSLPAQLNPLQPSQAIHLTAASSGSNGIKVLDDAELDMGTNDFTIPLILALPTYRPSSDQIVWEKHDGTNGVRVTVLTSGIVRTTINATDYDSTEALPDSDNDVVGVTISVTRETSGSAGSVDTYLNGPALGDSVSISSGTPTSVDNAANLFVLGDSSSRSEGTAYSSVIYNRALTASEVLDLHVNGVAFADRRGSQVNRLTVNNDFTDAVWSKDNATISTGVSDPDGGTNASKIEETADSGAHQVRRIDGLGDRHKRYSFGIYAKAAERDYLRITPTLSDGSTQNTWFDLSTGSVGTVESASFTTSIKDAGSGWYFCQVAFKDPQGSSTQTIRYAAADVDGNPTYAGTAGSGILIYEAEQLQLGATLALEPENIQPAPGQWLDSAHGNHALMPPEGATLTRPENRFRIQWEHTWDGTHEAQFIGGTDQNILPENAYIEYIIAEIIDDGSVQDFTIQDSTGTITYVSLTSGISAGIVTLALANRTHDGTNRDMTMDPDSNAQMTVKITIVGFILED